MPVVHHSTGSNVVDTEIFYDETFGLWSSPNVSNLCYPVLEFDMELPSDARLSDLQKPRWLSNQYPFVVFWPKWVSFNGPIFSRLNICDRTLSIQNIDMLHYALNSDIISSWQRLEHALVGLSLFLVKRAVGRKAELGFLPLPSDCGYASKHKEPRFKRYCAYKSRGAFIALTMFCSFAIAMNMEGSDDYRDEPAWVAACRGENVHLQWPEDRLFVTSRLVSESAHTSTGICQRGEKPSQPSSGQTFPC
jgi:hypothetical protein